MQKLDQIQKFVVLNEGEDATFVQPEAQQDARLIKMRINAPKAVNLFITPVDYDHDEGVVRHHRADDQIFLAHIPAGYDQLQFYYEGTFCLNAIGGDIWIDTYDNASFNIEASDPTSFARLFEREERHPAILEMERMARYNAEQIRQQNRAEMDAAIAAMEARMSANVPTVTTAAPVGKTGGKSSEGTQVPSGEAPSDQGPDAHATAAVSGEPA